MLSFDVKETELERQLLKRRSALVLAAELSGLDRALLPDRAEGDGQRAQMVDARVAELRRRGRPALRDARTELQLLVTRVGDPSGSLAAVGAVLERIIAEGSEEDAASH